jgi:hypothetical protein
MFDGIDAIAESLASDNNTLTSLDISGKLQQLHCYFMCGLCGIETVA